MILSTILVASLVCLALGDGNQQNQEQLGSPPADPNCPVQRAKAMMANIGSRVGGQTGQLAQSLFQQAQRQQANIATRLQQPG